MTKVYGVAQLTIHDPERYARYEENFVAILEAHGGRLIGFSQPAEALEGNVAATRSVILEFSSREALDGWYSSSAYQDILQHRLAASDGTVMIVNGVDVP